MLGEKFLFAAHMCLFHISELKKTAALSDYSTQVTNSRAVKGLLQQTDQTITANLAKVQAEAQELLTTLQDSYYGSRYKGRPTDTGISEQLRELCTLAVEASAGNRR